MLNVRKVKFFNHIKKAIILLFLSVITIFIIDYFTEEEVVADLVIANNNIVFGKTKVEDIKIGLSLDWEPASDMEEDSLYCYRITFKKYGGLVADHDVSGAIFCKEDKIVYVSIFINNENLSREESIRLVQKRIKKANIREVLLNKKNRKKNYVEKADFTPSLLIYQAYSDGTRWDN